uniref:G_PROTEIN_RECEP_F1_2 domain-containing protein n=1 Tax=Rhabditophanes sp. KR3021 TaxID=114890 RepID=A0AC35U586_9BILA
MDNPTFIIYAIAEMILSIFISLSNALVIWVFIQHKCIRTATNTYIFSLAVTDFLAGLIGVPFTVWSVITRSPKQFLPCLSVHLILCTLCTISTFHLLAMALDKYLTICSPLNAFFYFGKSSRHLRTVIMLSLAWVCGFFIGTMPLFDAFGFSDHLKSAFTQLNECSFLYVVDVRYLVFVIFGGTIIIPSIIISFCYVAIYRRIRQDEAQVSCLLRASDRQKRIRNRKKIIRTLIVLVLTYAVCWYPLYLLNTANYLFSFYEPSLEATLFTVWLSHLCCAINPIIYAYGMPGFKQFLRTFIKNRSSSRRNEQVTSIYHNGTTYNRVAFDVVASRSKSLSNKKSPVVTNDINYKRKLSVQEGSAYRLHSVAI